jgi:hypothetical protein
MRVAVVAEPDGASVEMPEQAIDHCLQSPGERNEYTYTQRVGER